MKFDTDELWLLAGTSSNRAQIWEKLVRNYPNRFMQHEHTIDVFGLDPLHRRHFGSEATICDVLVAAQYYDIVDDIIIDWMDTNLVGEWSLPLEIRMPDGKPMWGFRWTFTDEEDLLAFKLKWL